MFSVFRVGRPLPSAVLTPLSQHPIAPGASRPAAHRLLFYVWLALVYTEVAKRPKCHGDSRKMTPLSGSPSPYPPVRAFNFSLLALPLVPFALAVFVTVFQV